TSAGRQTHACQSKRLPKPCLGSLSKTNVYVQSFELLGEAGAVARHACEHKPHAKGSEKWPDHELRLPNHHARTFGPDPVAHRTSTLRSWGRRPIESNAAYPSRTQKKQRTSPISRPGPPYTAVKLGALRLTPISTPAATHAAPRVVSPACPCRACACCSPASPGRVASARPSG